MTTRRHALAAATALAISTLVAGAGPVGASEQLPFAVNLSGHAAFTSANTLSWTGSGQAVLMGRVTDQGRIVVTGPDGSCPGGLANVHTETLTAPNGDTLVLTSVDVGCPIGPNVVRGSGEWSVTGGTGRFANASGGGSAEGSTNFATGTFTGRFSGSITR